jgi:hypothetical protein
MTIDLVPLCTFTGNIGTVFDVGRTPAGRRIVFQVNDGRITGDRLSGRQVGQVDGDWLTIGADGTGTLDVRLLIATDDGALVLIQYHGRIDTTSPNAPVYSAPRFETGDERYQWLNRIQAVAKGTRDGETLTYEVCEVR